MAAGYLSDSLQSTLQDYTTRFCLI